MTEPAKPPPTPEDAKGCLVAIAIPTLLLLLVALVLAGRQLAFEARAVRAEGTVVEYKTTTSTRSRKGKSRTTRSTFEIVEYRDAGGRAHRVTSGIGHSSPAHRIGDKVVVLYEPEHPEEASLDDPMEAWFAPGILLVFASLPLLIVVLGVGRIRAYRRARRAAGAR